VQVFYHLFIYVLLLEIQFSRVDGLDPIYRFNPALFSSVCPRPELGFLTSRIVVFFVFTELLVLFMLVDLTIAVKTFFS
jgi:hypothetical protein